MKFERFDLEPGNRGNRDVKETGTSQANFGHQHLYKKIESAERSMLRDAARIVLEAQ